VLSFLARKEPIHGKELKKAKNVVKEFARERMGYT